MIRFDRCLCPKCGKPHFGAGRLGTSQQCSCGIWLPRTALDRVRHYWIFQAAISYGIASFFLALAFFFRDLPLDPWQRFFSPVLLVPAVTSFIVSYRILVRHKRTHDSDELMFKYYFWSVGLMSVGIVAALLIAISDQRE
jgi:hypothetical protein